MKIYECDIHDQDFELGDSEKCSTCRKILQQLKVNEEAHSRKPKIVKGIHDVHVGKDFQGQLIHNMDHTPVYVRSRRHYRDELRARGLAQK